MEWILVLILSLLVLSAVWFIIQYNRDLCKNREIFDEYLERQRDIKLGRRGRGIRQSKKESHLFKFGNNIKLWNR